MILKITEIVIISIIAYVILKREQTEFALILELVVTSGLFLLIMPYIDSVFDMVTEMTNAVSADIDFGQMIIKCSGIAIVSELIVELCKDAGENALGTKIGLSARVLILVQVLPIMKALLSLMVSLTENLL